MLYGERLKQLREAAGLKQSDVAAVVGVSSQAVSKWETNKSAPDGDAIKALCKLYNVTANDILGIDTPNSDEDIWQLREALRRDPERRMLFDAARNVKKEDIMTAARILDALKRSSEDGVD